VGGTWGRKVVLTTSSTDLELEKSLSKGDSRVEKEGEAVTLQSMERNRRRWDRVVPKWGMDLEEPTSSELRGA